MLLPANEDAQALFAKQVEVLFDQTTVALAATLVAAPILVSMFWDAAPRGPLIAWSALFLLVTAARYALVHAYRRSPKTPHETRRWLVMFLVGVTASGALWGATMIFLVPDESIIHGGFATLWICGLSAGAVAALSALKSAYFAFSLPALVPSALYLLTRNDSMLVSMGGAELLFLAFVTLNALRMHRTLRDGFRLQLENNDLITRLDEQRASVEELNIELEERVQERTTELATVNQQLKEDIAERQRIERALFAEKEQAQVTLHSIGDAVISTDSDGIVNYLNPVAEALTGWTLDEARGQSLSTVFRVIDEQTRAPISDPVARCLEAGSIQELDDNAILLCRDGREHAVKDSVAPIRGYDGVVSGVVVVFSDVTEARRLAQELAHQATHDALTGLVNRRQFEQRLRHALDTAQSQSEEHVLCYLDLDQFKIINDTCGHVAGDVLLRQLADRLLDCVRKSDTLSRLGGDEFGVLMEYCTLAQGQRAAAALRDAIREFRFLWEGRSFKVGVSIGLVSITKESEGITAVLRAADSACYAAKEAGRDRIHVYLADDQALARRRGQMQWVARIQRALDENRFLLYHQPIVPLGSGDDPTPRYEILLRLEEGDGTPTLPRDLLPSAERYDLAVKIDSWVVGSVFAWLARYAVQAKQMGICFINLSGQSLADEAFLEYVSREIDSHGIDPERICFEITETAMVTNLASALRFIKALKSRGCQFALDDFGSGLCSFAYLKTLPVDYLKIDGVFVKNVVNDGIDLAIVRSIHEIGKMLNKQTIAEWVEGPAIADRIRELGIDFGQGQGIAAPSPLPHRDDPEIAAQ